MYLCVNFTVDNWLALISLMFVAAGGIFIYFQWRKSVNVRRAEFIYQILEKLRFDDDLTKASYIIDYNQDWYDRSFHGGELEYRIDKLFSYIDYICYLKSTKNISDTEFKIFQYKIYRICVSDSSKVYLWNLYHFSRKNKAVCSFQYLVDYGIKEKLLSIDFKENSKLYNKILNW